MSIDTKKVIKVKQLECNRCHYQWYPRINRECKIVIPSVCANTKCKSPYWNKERVLNIKRKNNRNKKSHDDGMGTSMIRSGFGYD
jgi:hypothetical protein